MPPWGSRRAAALDANALPADHTTIIAVLANLREPDAILDDPTVQAVLDFDQPSQSPGNLVVPLAVTGRLATNRPVALVLA